MDAPSTPILRVTYMELRESPRPVMPRTGAERVARERLTRSEYLTLYRGVGESLRWDQRLQMSDAELSALLEGDALDIYVLRNEYGQALGFCEFDRSGFPEIELKNFGLVPQAQGRGFGPWLLAVALQNVWDSGASRIWLHTDTWDHPAAIRTYERAGLRVYAVRDQQAGAL